MTGGVCAILDTPLKFNHHLAEAKVSDVLLSELACLNVALRVYCTASGALALVLGGILVWFLCCYPHVLVVLWFRCCYPLILVVLPWSTIFGSRAVRCTATARGFCPVVHVQCLSCLGFALAVWYNYHKPGRTYLYVNIMSCMDVMNT